METVPLRPDLRRRIRTAVTIVYCAVVGGFIAVAIGSVARQLWPSPQQQQHVADADCAAALRDLARAVERARAAASASLSDDETEALARFRSALNPEWQVRETTAVGCLHVPGWAAALDVIERLRYAEERAVRRDVTELSPLRRKVDQLLATRPPNHP